MRSCVAGTRTVMPPKRRARSAPKERPSTSDAAPTPWTPPTQPDIAVDELEPLPPGYSYESADEDDAPPEVVEDAELIGMADRAPNAVEEGSEKAARTVGDSPTRSKEVSTGAEKAKKLTAAQERKKTDDAKWTEMKTDGTEQHVFSRPAFVPTVQAALNPEYSPSAADERGGPSPEVRAKLTADSHPAEFVAAHGFDKQLFSQMKASSNEYAASKGAGSDDYWKEFKPFSLEEIIAGHGLLLRNGVAPLPEMERVFDNPADSFVFGDPRANEVLPGIGCGGSKRRMNQFRSFLHVQSVNPLAWKITSPEGAFVKHDWRTAGPLSKLEPMLSYVRHKWQKCWVPGKCLSLDEMTIGFKGRHYLVTRIKYKKEGDGFQCDAICEDGYCYTFYFRCDNPVRPPPKDISDRDNRCSWLVEQLPGFWYNLWMDNLFTSWKFGEQLALRFCLFGGTCQTADWRGLHDKVVQQKASSAAQLAKARGTLKASWRKQELQDAEGQERTGSDVICCSYYDEGAEKPFHMMTNIPEKVYVEDIEKKFFSTSTQRYFKQVIKRLNVAIMYNFNMNSVDTADQLRNHLRPDGLWMRQRKWWWSIHLWALGQTLINAYLTYKRTCELEKKKPMSHLAFHVAVATAWCRTPKIVTDPDVAAAARRAGRSAASAASSASATPSPTTPAAAEKTKQRAPKLKMDGAGKLDPKYAESYHLNKGRHEVASVEVSDKGNAPNCQICVAGLGPHGAGRHQFDAHLRCQECGIQVCGASCWKVLHGMK